MQPQKHYLYVCTTCKIETKAENLDTPLFDEQGFGQEEHTPGERLFHIIKGDCAFQDSDLVILPTQCLSACKRGCTVALSSPTKYAYVLGEIDPTLLPDLFLLTQTYIHSSDGVLKKIHRPELLQKKVVARIPPLSS